jgi:O-antigen/teichoic acid export membrane protein
LSDTPLKLEESEFRSELSWFERKALATLRFVPGTRKNGVSNRVLVAMRGSVWTIAGYGASQLIRFATQLVLARTLLGPQAFGLVALVSVFLSGLEMLSDLGVGMDVIQHPRGDDSRFINTAFLIQAGRGLILFGLAAALAYPFAYFYHQPAVRWMIVVAALSVGIRGFSSGFIWTMTRRVQIGRLMTLNVGGDAVGFAVSLIWAYFSPTAWALVMGRVASSAVYVIWSHVISEHSVSLEWDSTASRDILMFGTGIFLSSATYFMSGEAERLIVGKFITVAELGCFSLALTLAAAPAQALSQVIGQVFFPMIAQSIREDQATAARHFKKVRWVFLLISVILGVGFIAYGPRIVTILLPPKFAMTGWMLQLLGWRAAQQVYANPTSGFVFACGDSKTAAISNLVRLVSLLIGLGVAFSKFGLHAALIVLALSSAIGYLVYIRALGRHLRPALWPEISGFLIFLASTGAAAIIPWPWR